jgi:hypothetical protein
MKAKKAMVKIEEIMGLEYDGYGEALDHLERFAMIFGVLERYKESLLKKENQDAGWEDRSAIQGINPGLAELIKANKESQDAP